MQRHPPRQGAGEDTAGAVGGRRLSLPLTLSLSPRAGSALPLPARGERAGVRGGGRRLGLPGDRCGGETGERPLVLAFFEEEGDRLVDLDALRALGDDDPAETALV